MAATKKKRGQAQWVRSLKKSGGVKKNSGKKVTKTKGAK
jgi:hypothetical protein